MTPEQIARLPVYAQRELEHLRDKVEHLKAELAAVTGETEPTDTRWHRYGEPDISLPSGALVRFLLGPVAHQHAVDVRVMERSLSLDRKHLQVMAADSVAIRPMSSNLFAVELSPW